MKGFLKVVKNVGSNLRAFVLALCGMVVFGAASTVCLEGLQPVAALTQWGSPTTTVVIIGAQVLLFVCLMTTCAVVLWRTSGWFLMRALCWVWLLVGLELGKGLLGFQVQLTMLELSVVGCVGTVLLVVVPRLGYWTGDTWTAKILPAIRLAIALSRKAQRGDLLSPSRISLNSPTLELVALPSKR